MKGSGRSIALAAASAALATGVLAAPAAADSSQAGAGVVANVTVHSRGDGVKPPAVLGDPKEWGVVELTIDDSAGSVTPMTTIEVGGGQWAYGWYSVSNGKYCYSNYYHYSVMHGSTVQIAGDSNKSVEAAGNTSMAHLTRGAAYTCKTFYAKY
ncbi:MULTISPECIES: lactococcin 972 family bacteriocin [unclassified Streptomyces]|uniref:lactococcin 972 family bacteriocin n=1 Tax=unclassified Streptomyces TaxID=2593676 RepID=UPI0034409FCA